MLFLQLAVYPANTLGSEKAGITVEQAVQIVKDNFSIPEKYSRMSTGYNEYNNQATYSLNWHSPEAPGGSFHAMVDVKTGEIININQWQESLKPSFKLPVLSIGDAEKIATDLVSKLASKHQAEMQLVKDNQEIFSLNNSQPFSYNFRWIRMVNGIPFPGNGVNVSVSGDNGLINNYNNNWTPDLVFPEASKVITPEKALQVFTDTPMLELQYFIPQITNPQTGEPQRVLLVYQLKDKYYGGAIDALNGEPVIPNTVGINTSIGSVGGGSGTSFVSTTLWSATTATRVTAATEAASPAIESSASQDTMESSQQISQAEAAEIVKKAVKIPKGLILQNSGLNTDWQNPSEQVWDLNWSSQSPSMGEHRFISAQVNAKTGDLISFYMSNEATSDDKSKPVTRKEAQKIADDFLEQIQPERFKLVKMDTEEIYRGKMPLNTQSFSYVRVVNGIPVSRNGMNITVDTVARQVNNYNMNWTNSEFPSSTDVLPLSKATEQFLKMRPLVLNYTSIFKQNGEQEARLVYQPNVDYNMYIPSILDAKTGDAMDWYGKSQSQWSKSHKYTDIQGNYAEKEIGIMGLTGAFGEYGETFRPDEKVTAGSLLRAMLTAEGNNRDRVLSDEDVLKIAKEREWIKDDLKLESELSRMDLSKIMIRLIDMDPSARVKGIYVLPFTDAATIEPDSLGYIALSWGLGILKIDGNVVQPNQSVTRAEAAYALVHAYALEPQSSNMK
ncbi:YcdB/YcdC domain-containing protein [Desulfosporosinus fructosivorans]